MFAKLPTVLALFAVTAQVAVATPPACLIAAVNTQSDPSDIKSVCTNGASDVQKYLSSNCGNNLAAATTAFAATCKSAGVTISTSAATKSSTATGSTTGTGSLPSATLTNGAQSGFHTATATSASSTASASGSDSSSGTQASQTGSATSTGGAARLSMDIVGLAAIGLAGFMLAM